MQEIKNDNQSRIHLYEELYFDIPDCNDVLPYVENVKEQVWVRPDLTKNLTSEDIATEYKRRREGVCFMNNGVKTYITGDHYFYLTYCRFNFGYPDYRDVDRRFFYAWALAVSMPYCLGLIRAKFRRLGATSHGQAILLNAGSMTEGVNCGIISKNTKSAAKVFRGIVDIMRRIPEEFVPQLENSDMPKREISFREPAKVVRGKISKEKPRSLKSLNTTIDFEATTINAYDSTEQYRLMLDEGGKLEKDAPFSELWEIHRTCLIEGDRVFGKAYVPSTVNEMTKGGKEFKKVWDDSSPYLTDEGGENIFQTQGATVSGLIRFFVPAWDGLKGFIDRYGFSVIDNPTPEQAEWIGKNYGAKEYLQREIDKRKNPNQKAERQRQFPTTIREAFSVNNKLSPFDTFKLNQQREFNEIHTNLTVRGDFHWIEKWKSVQWVPSESGRFLVAWMPLPENQNKIIIKNGKTCPQFESEGHFGLDPFSHDTVNDNRRSDAALYGILKPTPANPTPFFFLEYVHRPPTVENAAEDVAKACIFYGMPVLGESNKPETMNRFKTWGLENYLMDRPYENQKDYESNMRSGKREKWLPNTGGVNSPVRDTLVGRVQSYVYNHVGINEETGEMGKLYFNRLIDDLLIFDPEEKWTPFDCFVGAAYAVTGMYKFIPKKQVQQYVPYIPQKQKSTIYPY